MSAIPLEVLVPQVASRFDIVSPKRFWSVSLRWQQEYCLASSQACVDVGFELEIEIPLDFVLVLQDSQLLEILPKFDSGEGGVARQEVYLIAQ
jgi:hypothetical protein